MKLILGSQSAGRRHVLDQAGYNYTILTPNIDEKAIRSDDLNVLPLLVARAKMATLLPRTTEPAVLITADSIAVWRGQLREKPESVAQAREFLSSYSGNEVKNITGVIVAHTISGAQFEGVESATTYFASIPEVAIEALLAQGRIMHCAGAYAIENPLLAPYVKRVEGEVSCVTGLPLNLLRHLLDKAGYNESAST